MRSKPVPPFVPTPEEIEAGCREIQSRWSAETEVERRAGSDLASVPVYSIRHGRRGEVLVETAQ